MTMLGEKGDAIRFIRGTYKKLGGWIDKSKKKGSVKKSPVIVHNEDGTEHQTKIERASYRSAHRTPKSYGEAAIQQHPDMELYMVKFCELYVACGCTDSEAAVDLMKRELTFAFEIMRKSGHKAIRRHVDFP